MVRFLGFCDSKVCEILQLPRLGLAATLVLYKKEKKRKNPETLLKEIKGTLTQSYYSQRRLDFK